MNTSAKDIIMGAYCEGASEAELSALQAGIPHWQQKGYVCVEVDNPSVIEGRQVTYIVFQPNGARCIGIAPGEFPGTIKVYLENAKRSPICRQTGHKYTVISCSDAGETSHNAWRNFLQERTQKRSIR